MPVVSGSEPGAGQPKKGRVQACKDSALPSKLSDSETADWFDLGAASSNPFKANVTSPATELWPNASQSLCPSAASASSPIAATSRPDAKISPFSSTSNTSSSPATTLRPNAKNSPFSYIVSPLTVPTTHHPNWKALNKNPSDLIPALSEATKRASVAELKAADLLLAKNDLEHQLNNYSSETALITTANQTLTAENQRLEEAYQKLEKHTKNCEKATNKAQKEALHAKGQRDHVISTQKGQLKSAERRYEEAARELREWRGKYGSVEKAAEERDALQKRLSGWQSKAEKAQNEIAPLKEGGLQGGQQGVAGAEDENQSSTKAKKEDASIVAAAESKAARYKEERDLMHRMLREEMAKNAKLAESLVLRNAKLAESLEAWVIDDHGDDGTS